MPELPEVETTVRGIRPHIVGQVVQEVIIRDARLRWRVPRALARELAGCVLGGVARRAKYILIEALPAEGAGRHGNRPRTVLIHLGMSGSLRIAERQSEPRKHDHLDIVFGERCLRFRDPRRFGAVLWLKGDPALHRLLRDAGPEPLHDAFDGAYLYRMAKDRRTSVKSLIMNNKIVVGVGNIYANEACFAAGIRPDRGANRISLARYRRLADAIKDVLTRAIAAGGTTLQDFAGGDGQPGYFLQQLAVYGRGDGRCRCCGSPLREVRIAQRTTVFCARCQR